ncbi:hypothetical protein IAR55_003938 [Kwoniella newhampshirensis]|uniref:Uncharacterized protein n=1 Tax=Kwoniella newhampshirensis TaxID=1651941 RepID=A0AAW0YQL9_9TREE
MSMRGYERRSSGAAPIMGPHALIPAVVHTSHHNEPQPSNIHEPFPASGPSNTAAQIYNAYPSQANLNGANERTTIQGIRSVSYGSTSDTSVDETSLKGKDRAVMNGEFEDDTGSEDGLGLEPVIDVTWKYMSRLYLLVPIITLVWLALLMLLVTFAWPPNNREREAGQQYPHPFLPKPIIIGIFASCTVQTVRVPTWVVVCWFGCSQTTTTFLSTALHTIVHELLRLSTLPLIVPSPTSGFHSSYYLGLGWGAAEATWSVVQGWEQLALYQEIMRPSRQPIALDPESQGTRLPSDERDVQSRHEQRQQQRSPRGDDDDGKLEGMLSSVTERSEEDEEREDENAVLEDEEEEDQERLEEEAELERKVEILERMRARRELEEVIGVAYPNIPFPLLLLWRLDTLLLNLGLTLLLSAFYFNPTPIYRHSPYSRSNPFDMVSNNGSAAIPDVEPSRWLWLVWGLVVLVHVAVSLVWKIVGRLGVGAVTWGGLIVALGSVFAGLGSWGGLV